MIITKIRVSKITRSNESFLILPLLCTVYEVTEYQPIVVTQPLHILGQSSPRVGTWLQPRQCYHTVQPTNNKTLRYNPVFWAFAGSHNGNIEFKDSVGWTCKSSENRARTQCLVFGCTGCTGTRIREAGGFICDSHSSFLLRCPGGWLIKMDPHLPGLQQYCSLVVEMTEADIMDILKMVKCKNRVLFKCKAV